MQNPTVEQLFVAIDALTPEGGPGFLVLEHPGFGFVQVAGGDGAYAVEWRDWQGSDESSPLYAAGTCQGGQTKAVRIPTNGFQVTVMANECLTAEDAKVILGAYLKGEARPEAYVWRDVSDQIPPAPTQELADAAPPFVVEGATGIDSPNFLKIQLAAIRGDANAQFKLAECYRIGLGLPQDAAAAIRWLRAAAEQGNPDAQNDLGSMYRIGQGVAEDAAQALYWYGLAAQSGDPAALFNLGKTHLHGLGTAVDFAAALECFSRAAEKGYIEAICELGTMHRFGHGVAQNLEAAAIFHVIAALEGDVVAMGNLVDYRKQLEALALAGNQSAALNLAKMYDRGLGVEKEQALMFAWLTWARKDCMPDKDEVCREEVESMWEFYRCVLDAQTKKKASLEYEVLKQRSR